VCQERSSLYIPAQLTSSNRGWQEGWFYLRNDDDRLPPYTGNPNSIAQEAIFAAIYEGYLGIPPHWNLWLHLFKAEHFTKAVEGEGSQKMVRASDCTL
jgi:hypothetical protein